MGGGTGKGKERTGSTMAGRRMGMIGQSYPRMRCNSPGFGGEGRVIDALGGPWKLYPGTLMAKSWLVRAWKGGG
jgi:hypothetical protein